MVIDDKTNQINISSKLPLEVSQWNTTDIDYPLDRTVITFFEQQVCDTPQRIAVRFEGESLTYLELNRRANCVAKELINRGIQPEDLTHKVIGSIVLPAGVVAICLDEKAMSEVTYEYDVSPEFSGRFDTAVYMVYTSGSTGKTQSRCRCGLSII